MSDYRQFEYKRDKTHEEKMLSLAISQLQMTDHYSKYTREGIWVRLSVLVEELERSAAKRQYFTTS